MDIQRGHDERWLFELLHRHGRIANVTTDALMPQMLVDRRRVDETHAKLCRRADVQHGNPHDRRFGETGTRERDQRRDAGILAAKHRDEESHGVRCPRENEAEHGDDDT